VPAVVLAVLGLAAVAVRSTFLAQTKAALLKGELPARGGLLSPKAGCLYFVDAIDGRTFEAFLSKSTDPESTGFVIGLLGWKHRVDLLERLSALAASGGQHSERALLSVVAIENGTPFRGTDFAGEFYRGYASRALRLAKEEGIPLRQAALRVSNELRAESAEISSDNR
jgi:hypothetical protein